MIWSKKSLNPETLYNHPDGTIKGELGYWVMTLEECDECLRERRKQMFINK